MELLPVGVFRTDTDGFCQYANRKWLSMTGLTFEQAKGKGWMNILHPEDHEHVLESIDNELVKTGVWNREFRFITPRKAIVWVQGMACELLDDAGGRVGFIGVAIDITERKQAEKAIRESEEKFRQVYDHSIVGISLADLNGNFINCNPAVEKILGYSPGDYCKLSIKEISHPDEALSNLTLFKEMVSGGRDSYTLELRYRHRDGHYIWGNLTRTIVRDDNQKPLFSIGMFEDISERKEAVEALRASEEKFRRVFNDSGMGISLIDLEGRFISCNPAVSKILGYSPEEYTRLTVHSISHPDDGVQNLEYVNNLKEGKVDHFTMEKRNRHKDGHYVWGQLTSSMVRDAKGKPLFIIGMFEDITERKAAVEALRQFNIELQEAYDATLQGWSAALEMRERETAGHSHRVVRMTLDLARAAGIDGDRMMHIERGALLHDIGKMGIPDSILLKPGPLTEDEWVVMRQHPVYAYRLLSHIPYLRPALEIPYHHHERWDGTGYPQGLTGEAIPLPARLFAVIDVWDALSSDRPYRPAWSPDAIRSYIDDQAGKQFDPEVVRLFFEMMNNAREE
jgi:PAS domain S-box-containing protein